jgi:hypothetical protein
VERINAAPASPHLSHTPAAEYAPGDTCPCLFLFGIIGGFAPLAVQGELTPATFLGAGLGALLGLIIAYK